MDEHEQTQTCSRQGEETQKPEPVLGHGVGGGLNETTPGHRERRRDARVLEYFGKHGHIFDSRGAAGHDLVGQMSLARRNLGVLARGLAAMGITESGDDPADLP